MNWDDPAARAELIERVGPDEYNRLFEEHRKASVLAVVGGHEIRPAYSFRFGNLFMVGNTGVAFSYREDAEKYARENPR